MAGIYVHYPYCTSKCSYCNFYSVANRRGMDLLPDAILKEAQLRKHEIREAGVETIYLGGGTPSLLEGHALNALLTGLREIFSVSDHAEITIEANPEHLSPSFPDEMAASGVNRISIGIQSLDDRCLSYLGRSHDAAAACLALERLKRGAVRACSADLIFGIPGQSDASLRHDLNYLVSSGIQHISAYALTLEENTALAVRIRQGKAAPPDESQTAAQFLLVMEQLEELGFHQYEISNYCLPGHESRHNAAYWNDTPYLGLGPSAHSFDGQSRQWNTPSVNTWLQAINSGKISQEKEVLGPAEKFNEFIMTRLRTAAGIDLSVLQTRFGAEQHDRVLAEAGPHLNSGTLVRQGDRLSLTRQGKLFADRIASDLFA